jgi:hypothetical protein
MFKKMTVLAMALGVVAAMALPGTAAASWKHHDTAIQNDAHIGLTGQVGFQSGLGGIACQITSTVTFFAGQTTGAADTFNPHPTNATTNCVTSGGLAQCQVETVQPTDLPWTLHTSNHVIHRALQDQKETTTEPSIEVTFGDIHGDLFKKNLFCPFEHSTVTAGTAYFTPNPADGKTITSVSLTGETQGHLYSDTANPTGTTSGLTLSGTLNVEAPNSATYSI